MHLDMMYLVLTPYHLDDCTPVEGKFRPMSVRLYGKE